MNEPTEMILLIPAKGLLVRDPMTGLVLPPEGGLVPKNDYWQRRIAQGDAVLGMVAKPTPPPASEQRPTKKIGDNS